MTGNVKGLFIFVLDRGFVVAGLAGLHPEFAFSWEVAGRTVRQWGTSEGLSELCDGPLPGTVLDRLCDRIIPFRSVIEMLEVSEEGREPWDRVLTRDSRSATPRRR
jgi:hypothetical protein